MPWCTWERLVQKKNSFFFPPTVNACLLLTSLKACDWSAHIFGASVSPRSLKKKTAHGTLFHCSWRSAWYQICDIRVFAPSSTVHGGQHYTKYVTFEYCMRHSWLAKFGVTYLRTSSYALYLLEPQFRFGDKSTLIPSDFSPKWDCGSKRVS